MSNSEMISVPRELLERVANEADRMLGFTYASNCDECRAAVDELLALLAAPAESCGACGGCANGCRLDRESPPAAQPQGEPVAWLDPAHGLSWLADRMSVMPGTKLYTRPAEQPAPAAVVLPDRKPEPSCMTAVDDDREAEIWNACLDAVARLNKQ
ncbi:hypothetical protein [Pseudomonas sp. MRSN 12121]|uniref:hypothetical protein n=1 Tax=Pseudomonas sp. MRSN 12121 TaxID=1611770 RepID=UPI0005BEB21B|nr:hypothetical protein [Pseudomonas sp. MRSN 12121]AJO79117.1 hypothetical protein TO66_18230 [Pseudomonas sp. MRSN 12121]